MREEQGTKNHMQQKGTGWIGTKNKETGVKKKQELGTKKNKDNELTKNNISMEIMQRTDRGTEQRHENELSEKYHI